MKIILIIIIISNFIDISEIFVGSTINNNNNYTTIEDNEKFNIGKWMMLIGGTSFLSSILFYNMIGNYIELFVDPIINQYTYICQVIFHNLFGTIIYITSKLVLTTYSINLLDTIIKDNLYYTAITYYIYSYISILLALIYIIINEYYNMKNNRNIIFRIDRNTYNTL